MRDSGEMFRSSEVIQTGDQERDAWLEYLTRLVSTGTTYDQLTPKDR